MPPRYAYWTIIAGGLPTAFRAAHREELLPTFQRIKDKHPDAQMKYFARGKLWESAEAVRAAETRRGVRDRDWRPGGNHRDPRQKFIDAKKQRNAAVRKERWERRNAPPRGRKPWIRSQGTEEPEQPPRPRGPNREPRPSEDPQPTPPPREEQPKVPQPGPPERGFPRRRYQPKGRFPKGPRR
jgi:hypothetical protein